jgi:hypothetical protein
LLPEPVAASARLELADARVAIASCQARRSRRRSAAELVGRTFRRAISRLTSLLRVAGRVNVVPVCSARWRRSSAARALAGGLR